MMRRIFVHALLLGLALETGVSAQVTTGRLMGRIVDESGAALAGVSVSIVSPAQIGGARTGVSDDQGEVLFLSLAPGEYTVTATMAGFATQERTRVKVSLGGATALTVAMPLATFSDQIEVLDETPVVDPTQVDAGQVFPVADLLRTGIERSYLIIVRQTAGVTGGSFGGRPQARVFGSTIGENAYFVDGLDTTDPVMAIATASLNLDAIAEIELKTGGFEAEFGRATGGIINLVTKSGGNRFGGTVDLRYYDQSFQEGGDHFDPEALDNSYSALAATLGGPIRRDRTWFFASYELKEQTWTREGAFSTTRSTRENFLGKVTWQIADGWRLTGRYWGHPMDNDNWNAFRWVRPEADSHVEENTAVFSGELSSILSDSLFWNTVVGGRRFENRSIPQSGDLRAIGHYNFDTGLYSHNAQDQEYGDDTRAEASSDLTWFVDDLAGSHELKGGIALADLGFQVADCWTGTPNGERCVDGGAGFVIYDIELAGETTPLLLDEWRARGPTDYSGLLTSAFVQDAWRAARNLTVKVGLRYDAVSYDSNDGRRVAEMDRLQPRVGFAWDLFGDARNLLRGSWGRYMHPGGLTLPWFLDDVATPMLTWYSCSGFLPLVFGMSVTSAEECAALASAIGFSHRFDHEAWDPYGWVLNPEEVYYSDPYGVDPGLRAPYADELILAFERAVGERASIELTYVDKKTRDLHDATCRGNVPTPSADAACDSLFIANFPALRRDYQGFLVRYETRSLDWLVLLASYAYSSSRGSLEYTQGDTFALDFYPWHFDNIYGYLSDHRRHRLKVNGALLLGNDWTLAFDASWTSPFTWTPFENRGDNPAIPWGQHFLEPRGSREGNSQYQLHLQVSKGFTVGPTRLELIASVYNAFSDERPTWVCGRISGCGDFQMGDATAWQTPRSWEVGLRVEF